MGARVLSLTSKLKAAYEREEHMLNAIPTVLAVTLPEVSTATIAGIVGAIHGLSSDIGQQPLFVDPIERARFWVREKRREDRGITDYSKNKRLDLPQCLRTPNGKCLSDLHVFPYHGDTVRVSCAELRGMFALDNPSDAPRSSDWYTAKLGDVAITHPKDHSSTYIKSMTAEASVAHLAKLRPINNRSRVYDRSY